MNASARTGNLEAEAIRAVHRERSAALLVANVQAARAIHADDFQLVTPLGAVFSKDQYLGAVEAGILKYSVMELDSPVDVRMYREAALIRYRAQIEVDVQGQRYPRAAYWFTDAYEKRDGRWRSSRDACAKWASTQLSTAADPKAREARGIIARAVAGSVIRAGREVAAARSGKRSVNAVGLEL